MSDDLTIEINGQKITASMAIWGDVERLISARQVEQRKAWEQEQRAAGQVWYAHYWRYHQEYKDECFSLEDAAGQLYWGSENGDCAPVGVICPDGTTRTDYEEIARASW